MATTPPSINLSMQFSDEPMAATARMASTALSSFDDLKKINLNLVFRKKKRMFFLFEKRILLDRHQLLITKLMQVVYQQHIFNENKIKTNVNVKF